MMLLSLKEHFKLLSHSSSVPLKHTQLRRKQTKALILQKLPPELIASVYYHLETPACKSEFAQTCKSFYQISAQSCSKAGWIFTRVGPRLAIYYALLSCPSECTSSFIKILLHFGAAIPYHLIQSVVRYYGKPKEQYQHNRRRSSQSMDDHFHQQIQKLPFDGFVMLLYEGNRRYDGHIDMQQLQLGHSQLSLSSSPHQKEVSVFANEKELKQMVYERWFFPAPYTSHYSLRSLMKYRSEFESLFPLFEFDPNARAQLWETLLSLLFDEAFKSGNSTTKDCSTSSITLSKQHQELFEWLGNRMNRRLMLLGPLTDGLIFSQVFTKFFAKYPVGYCHELTMMRLLALLTQYIKLSFNLEIVLEEMAEQQSGRPDIARYLKLYLQEQKKGRR